MFRYLDSYTPVATSVSKKKVLTIDKAASPSRHPPVPDFGAVSQARTEDSPPSSSTLATADWGDMIEADQDG